MNCSKCGFQNNPGQTFCTNCGNRLDNMNVQQQMPQYIGNQMYQQPMQNVNQPLNYNYSNVSNLDPKYINKAVNPNMMIWAIISIILPVASMIFYWFVGLSFYIAILLAAAGYSFAQKGAMANKTLALIGKILNVLLAVVAFVMLILIITGHINN